MGLSHLTARMINKVLPWGWRLSHESDGQMYGSAAWRELAAERDRLAERLLRLTDASRAELSRSGLFVIGHARSGTTVLQNALNDHEQIFILNEANLYCDPGTPDFRARHNEKHHSLRNQENKGTHCPKLFDGDESWDAYLLALARTYRYVGTKIAITPGGDPAATEQLFDFATANFYNSAFIFTFRDPWDVVMSNRNLALWNGEAAPSEALIMSSYLKVMRLYIRMLRNLPKVQAVFHDGMDPSVFARIGASLGLDLKRSFSYYSDRKTRAYPREFWEGADRGLLDQVGQFYVELRRQSIEGHELLQIDQNLSSIDPAHKTPLGRLAQHIDIILAALPQAAGDR